MENKLISQMSETVFGVDLLEIYLDRNIFETKALILSDFASNGFFWAQIKDELLSQEYKNIYEIINSAAEEPKNKPSSLNTKWCVAKFQGEWFRAYIVQLLDNNKVRVFFIDYGSFEVIDGKDTRDLGNLTEDVLENIWALHHLALPCVLKSNSSKIEHILAFRLKSFLFLRFASVSNKKVPRASV